MTFRLAADEARYQAARARGDVRPLHTEELVQEYTHWRIVKNRFPHSKLADTHHTIVLKRSGEVSAITYREWREFLKIVAEIQHDYDSLTFNFPSVTSIKHVPHFHLYRLKPDFSAQSDQQALEVAP